MSVINLYQQFAEGSIEKTYHALSHGMSARAGSICLEIDGKKSETQFQCLTKADSIQGGGLSLLRLQPKTGRTHQIRKHLKAIGHPIVGDKLYNELGKTYQGKGLFLVATKLKFRHPKTNKIVAFEIPIPNKFHSFLDFQRRRLKSKTDERLG